MLELSGSGTGQYHDTPMISGMLFAYIFGSSEL